MRWRTEIKSSWVSKLRIALNSLMTVLLCSGPEAQWCAAADCWQILHTMLLPTPSDIVPIRFFLADLISIAAVLLHDTLLDIGSSASAAYRNIPVGSTA